MAAQEKGPMWIWQIGEDLTEEVILALGTEGQV